MSDAVSKSIFQAIEDGSLEEVQSIYKEKGVKGNIFDENGMSALMQAAYKARADMCKFLLTTGADVNATCHDNQYTALMMACLSGSTEVVNLLLNHGANPSKLNSIGKSAAQLAAFVGQHECSSIIKNFLSMDKFDPYVTSQGDKEPRFPASAAPKLQELVMLPNPHPVKIVLFISDYPELRDEETLVKAEHVLTDLCRKCVRAKDDYDEVLALKLHYFSNLLELCHSFLNKNKDKQLDALAKKLLKADPDGFQVTVETTIRKAIQQFPYTDMPLLQQFVKTIAPVQIGCDPTALSCLVGMFGGLHAASLRHHVCETCGTNASSLRCSVCKKVSYCTKRCQKLHWFVHKKLCQS